MAGADPLTLTVRENAAWCDLVCRLHRFTPEGDGRLWWSARRTPDLFPDAVTLVPDLSELDVLGRINTRLAPRSETPLRRSTSRTRGGVCTSTPRGSRVDPGRAGRRGRVHIRRRPREFPVRGLVSCLGGPAGVLPIGLRRVPGVTVLGREGDAGFADGAIVHCTEIGGTAVAGLWNAFGAWADIADEVSHRHPEAWIVGYERGVGLDAALAAGFTPIGPLHVWNREHVRP